MSLAIDVYTVKLDDLRTILRSRSSRRVNFINKQSSAEFDSLREQLDDDNEDRTAFTYEDAVHDLLFNRLQTTYDWHIYGYAIQAILDTYAEYCGNWPQITNLVRFTEHLNEILIEHDVGLDVTNLTYGGGPKGTFPTADDGFSASSQWPEWGCWSASQCKSILPKLKRIDISSLDPMDHENVQNLVDWVGAAVRRKSMIIGFVC